MSQWIAAQIMGSKHEYVAHHVRRVGYESFYPRTRQQWTRPDRVVVEDLYPGYMFIRSPHYWYSILDSCSAIFGIVRADSTDEPLRSHQLDSHVEKLLRSRDKDGFVPLPKRGPRFLRGDRINLKTLTFSGLVTYLRPRGEDSAEVTTHNHLKILVREADLATA